MGKYSNINVSSLLNNVISAQNELSNHNLNYVYDDLSNEYVLVSQARQLICTSLDNIMHSKNLNGSIYKLNERLNNLREAAEYIQRWQILEKRIKASENNLENDKNKKNDSLQSQINNDKENLKDVELKINNLLS